MSSHYILDGRKAVPATLQQWAKWYESADRRVQQTRVGAVRVSTVFLGLDHSFGGDAPLLFETMVFGGPMDEECHRCTTWQQAVEQHEAVLEAVIRSAA